MNSFIKKSFYIFFIIILLTFSIVNETFASDTSAKTSSVPSINSQAAILIENETGNVLYTKNSQAKMYPASTTKIMTAILAIEHCDLDEIATVSQNAVDLVPKGYTNAKLVAGEEISIENLLYALMLNSANEAANVIAEHISGSIDDFATVMNLKAEELGCKNTHFVNANGMHDSNHYTTAEDLATIAKYCMQNETFRKIVSTTEYTLPATNKYANSDRIMKNTNLLIMPSSSYYYEYAIGVKTGYTKQAGNCLVSFAEKDGIQLICVTLKAESTNNSSSYRFQDSKNLLTYGFENFSTQKIIEKNTVIDNIEISNASKESKNLEIVAKDDVSDYIANDSKIEETNVELNDNQKAPINVGDVVGKVTYTVNNKTYTSDLIANNTIYVNNNYKIYIIATLIVLGIGVIIFLIFKKTNKNKNKPENEEETNNFFEPQQNQKSHNS